MKIQPFGPNNPYIFKKYKGTKETNKQIEKKDVYAASKAEKVAHGKITKYDQISIKRLKDESERAYETLRRIVMELIHDQSRGELKLRTIKEENLQIEAARLIADDGPLGAEAVSNRIVDFAIALSGGDKSKLTELKAAIEEGFRQVEDILGGLPEVSLKTYSLIMEKLDKWEHSI